MRYAELPTPEQWAADHRYVKLEFAHECYYVEAQPNSALHLVTEDKIIELMMSDADIRKGPPRDDGFL